MEETFVPFRGIKNDLEGRLLCYKQDWIGGLRAGISPITSVYVSAILLGLTLVTLLGLTLVGRAAFVFPLSFLSNLAKKSPNEKIDFKQQVTIWWAGLMRGVVSMTLAYNQFTRAGHAQLQGNAILITSTITVVLFSNVIVAKQHIELLTTRVLYSESNELEMTKMSVQNSIFAEYTHVVLLEIMEGKTSATSTNSKQEMF